MDEMALRYADRGVTSVFIYTREAHPGENLPHHTSMDLKRSHARAFRDECRVERRILIDDLAGSAHHEYGLLPNMSYILARGGLLLYKASWTHAPDIETALRAELEGLERRSEGEVRPFYTERLGWRIRDEDGFRHGLERAGPQAVRDFYDS